MQITMPSAVCHGCDTGAPDLVSMIPVPVLVCRDGRFTYANPAAVELFGVGDVEDLVARLADGQLVASPDLARVVTERECVARSALVARLDVSVVRPDGQRRHVDWTVRHLPDGSDAYLHVLVDMTGLVDARDALAAAELHQREIVASLAEGVIVVDAHGVCTDANDAAVDLLRLPSVDMLLGAPAHAMPMVDAVGDPLDPALHPIRRALEGGERIEHELFRVRFGTRARSMRVSVTVLERYGYDGPVGAAVTFTDVTDELAAAAALAASEQRFRELAARAPVGIFETSPAGACTYVNERACEFTGRDAAGMLDDRWVASIHPDDVARVTDRWSAAVADRAPLTIEYRYQRPDGAVVPVHAVAAPLLDGDGDVTGWLATATDLSEQMALRDELARNERRFRELAERSPDVVLRYGLLHDRFEYLSPAARALLGVAPEAVYLDRVLFHRHVHPDDRTVSAQLLHGDAPPLCELRTIGSDGVVRTLEARTAVDRDANGRAIAIEAVIRDVTEAAGRQRKLQDLAHRDELTGLPNRRAMMDELPGRIAAGDCAVLFVDLDGFKPINDRLGHDAGDEVLSEFAQLLRASIRGTDEAFRLGGDEFVVITTPAAAPIISARLLNALTKPFTIAGGNSANLGASIGVATARRTLDTADGLINRADAAMYEAKRLGRGQVVVAA